MTDRAATTTLQRLAERVAALNPYPFHATVSLRAVRELRCVGDECGIVTSDNGTCPVCGGAAIPEPNYRLAPWAIPSGADR